MMVPATFKNKSPEISIWLDDTDDDVLKKFHCSVCGKTVFEYYGHIKGIIAGRHNQKRPKVIQCNNLVILDNVSKQVVNVPMDEFGKNRNRYFKAKCHTKYWIS